MFVAEIGKRHFQACDGFDVFGCERLIARLVGLERRVHERVVIDADLQGLVRGQSK